MGEKNKKYAEIYKSYIKASSVGLEFGLSIALPTLIGYFVDKHFLSSPYGLIIGCGVGFLAGIKTLYVFSKEYIKKNKDDTK